MSATWRQIADILAERLMHHAYCPAEEHTGAPDLACPFCQDIAAYDAYIAKGGTMRKAVVTGESVNLWELVLGDRYVGDAPSR